MAEYGEVLDMDDRTKPAQGGWMDGNTQGGEEAQFPNSFLYMDQASVRTRFIGSQACSVLMHRDIARIDWMLCGTLLEAGV
jgi:hypothetical protein